MKQPSASATHNKKPTQSYEKHRVRNLSTLLFAASAAFFTSAA